MDLAAGISSKMATRGRLVTVATQNVDFISPVKMGATVSCYTNVVNTGKISVQINVEVGLPISVLLISLLRWQAGSSCLLRLMIKVSQGLFQDRPQPPIKF